MNTRPNRWRILTWVSLILLLPARPAGAETVISKSYSYFSVYGTNAAELDKQLARKGPKITGYTIRHPGLTQIKFGGTFTYSEEGGNCRIASVKVTLSTKIILPRWRNRDQADSNLRHIWDTLFSDIKRHEERHAEIARNHARDLERKLKAIPRGRNCDILKAKVSKISDQQLAQHDKDQARFDRIESINFEKRVIRLLKNRGAGE